MKALITLYQDEIMTKIIQLDIFVPNNSMTRDLECITKNLKVNYAASLGPFDKKLFKLKKYHGYLKDIIKISLSLTSTI